MEDKEAQRKLLRAKIRAQRGQRTGTSQSAAETSAALLRDPASALLALGVDDPETLANAKSIVSSARSIAASSSKVVPTEEEEEEAPPPESSDDEAPPP